jgi:hypothetical protein
MSWNPNENGPGAITRSGPPSLRDARALVGQSQHSVTEEKGKTSVDAMTYARFAMPEY